MRCHIMVSRIEAANDRLRDLMLLKNETVPEDRDPRFGHLFAGHRLIGRARSSRRERGAEKIHLVFCKQNAPRAYAAPNASDPWADL